MIPLHKISRIGEFIESRVEVTRCKEEEESGELLFNADRFSVWVMKKFWKWIVVMVAHCEYN